MWQIIHEYLGVRNYCARWVPHKLTINLVTLSEINENDGKMYKLNLNLPPQPPYSPDLILSDFWLFKELTSILAWKKSKDIVTESPIQGLFLKQQTSSVLKILSKILNITVINSNFSKIKNCHHYIYIYIYQVVSMLVILPRRYCKFIETPLEIIYLKKDRSAIIHIEVSNITAQRLQLFIKFSLQ